MTRRGRVRHEAVEGGTWILETRDGAYVLLGSVPSALDGREVEVEGEDVESFGIAMAGPQFEVRSIRAR